MCAPWLQLLGVDSTNLVLGWQSIAGRSYGIMTSSNLAASSWQVLTNLTVQTNGPMAVTCPLPASAGYYSRGWNREASPLILFPVVF